MEGGWPAGGGDGGGGEVVAAGSGPQLDLAAVLLLPAREGTLQRIRKPSNIKFSLFTQNQKLPEKQCAQRRTDVVCRGCFALKYPQYKIINLNKLS